MTEVQPRAPSLPAAGHGAKVPSLSLANAHNRASSVCVSDLHGIFSQMNRLDDFRSVFAQVVMARAGVTDLRLLEAFSKVLRHEFIGPSPWYFTEQGPPVISEDQALLYQDVSIAL